MQALPLALGLVALASVAGFVAAPLVRPARRDDDSASAALPLLEQRDRALAALRELEFDHRTGKIADDDYAALRNVLRARAAEALQAVGAGGA